MAKSGPIILVEDDFDDRELFQEALQKEGIENKLICFDHGDDTYKYLKSTNEQPFIIFCDINLPIMTGIEFKRKLDVDSELRKKSIPFIFFSTSVDKQAVDEAYRTLTIQGFFQKPQTFENLTSMIKVILDYWELCKHPGSGENIV